MKIGILGGTFDPPHSGHLSISLEVYKKFSLNKIIWLVTEKNPLKINRPLKNIEERLSACKKIICKNKNLISIVFLEQLSKSNFLYENIRYLLSKNNNKYYFIMGADSFINFYKWKNYKKILDKVPIIVVNRQNYNIKSLNSLTAQKLSNLKSNFINNKNFKNKWTFLNTKGVSISSSEIRNKVNGS